jgi:hypothetical protein
MTTAVLSLSLTNSDLYAGCETQEVAGRLTLTTHIENAVNIIGRNAKRIVEAMVSDGVDELILTGAMAIWAYLVVFHIAVHRFRRIYYDDGKTNGRVLIAAH